MKKDGFTFAEIFAVIIILMILAVIALPSIIKVVDTSQKSNDFVLISSNDNKVFDSELMSFAKDNNIDLEITHLDDIEAIDRLEDNSSSYDGLWLSNSTWIYMLDNVKTMNSKSININPIVFGVKKSKAEELGFVNKDIYNKDIVNAIKNKKLKYVMSSVIKTNTGLVSYLGFLNSLAGSPEILTSSMLNNKALQNDLVSLFSGVERVSGSEDFLTQMFLNNSEYEAVIASESELISINKQLSSKGRETLYLLYPVDGVAVNDSPFVYIDNKQDKLEIFNKLQSFLLSSSSQKKLESLGKRTWYGGINEKADSSSFKKEWGIDTNKYLIASKYPSKAVINEAIDLYIDLFRKESATVFCLDFSGSMYGEGDRQLKDAMDYILDYNKALQDRVQFSKKDIVIVLPFSDNVMSAIETKDGRNTADLISKIDNLYPGGGTNLYGCASRALDELNKVSNNYTKTVVLMTDGAANIGSFYNFSSDYNYAVEKNKVRIPFYSIMFGSAKRSQLEEIAMLTNARVFDGSKNLKSAFKEVRSYN